MTLPEVRRHILLMADELDHVQLGGFADRFRDIAKELADEPDFRLRERLEKAVRFATLPSPDGRRLIFTQENVAQFFGSLLGPSPGPTLRERVEKMADDIEREFNADGRHGMDYGKIPGRIRAVLDESKETPK